MKIVETLLIVIAILGFAHSAHAHGIAGNRFFQGRFRLMILPLLTSPYCLSSQVPSTQMKGATSSITGLPGLFSVYSLQRSESVSIADGFTANGAAPGARASIQRILRYLTIKGEVYRNDLHETLVSAGLGWGIGHSGAQGAGANAPDLIAPGSATFPLTLRGCDRLASPAHLRSNTR